MDNAAVLEKWEEIVKIVAESGDELIAGWFLSPADTVTWSEKEKTLSVYLSSIGIMMIGINCRNIIVNAVKHLFGEDAKLELKDKNEFRYDAELTVVRPVRQEKNGEPSRPAVAEPDPLRHTDSYIRQYEEMMRVGELIRDNPGIFLGKNIHSELFFRVISNFINCAELIGMSNHIRVTRQGNRISVHDVEGFGFHLRMLRSELELFRNADYFSYTVPGFSKLRRHKPYPFYYTRSSCEKNAKRFYINTDLYLTMFMLVNLSDFVVFENISGNGTCERFTYKDGKSLSEYEEKDVSDKNFGSCIVYRASPELTNDEICRVLESAALLSGGVEFSFIDFDNGRMNSYRYDSAGEFLHTRKHFKAPCFCKTVMALGQDRYNEDHYHAGVELAFGFAPATPFTGTYYNYSLLEEENAFSEKLCEGITKRLNARISEGTERRLDVSDVRKITSFILNIRTDDDCTNWTSAREGVGRRQMLCDVLDDVLDEAFGKWFDDNGAEARALISQIFSQKEESILEEIFPDGMK